jgi:antirestriction protein ArdC
MSVSLAHDVVTDRVISALEKGTVPWRQPWRADVDHPRNPDGRLYRGVNVWLLLAQRYGSPYWLTFNQVKQRRGYVRRGERATPVVFWKQLQVEDQEHDGTRTVPLLKYYSVFNVEQTEGILPPAVPELPRLEPIQQADSVVAAMPHPPQIRRECDRAAYMPAWDMVSMPRPDRFESADGYYSTLFHELGHSTGHASRLAREGIVNRAKFGSMDYGREELIAEMTAAYLCGQTGILPATIDNTAAYLDSWIRTIREDRRAVVVAAGAAQRAADYILGLSKDQAPAMAGVVALEAAA